MKDDTQPLRVVFGGGIHHRATAKEIEDSELRRKLSAMRWLLAVVALIAVLVDVMFILSETSLPATIGQTGTPAHRSETMTHYLTELSYSDTSVQWTSTEEDPDGADRGGYHQLDEGFEIKDGTIHHTYEMSDCYEERMGEEPDPEIESQEDAVSWLRNCLKEHQAACEALEKLIKRTEAATAFSTSS